jgi:thiol-disulfide isomerase/thioredoxin
MSKKLFLLLVSVLLSIYFAFNLYSQEVKILKFDGLKSSLETSGSRLKVVNFWATWCRPCVEEMPSFLKFQEIYKDKIDLILVALDYPSTIDKKVLPFLKSKGISQKVIVLDEPDPNEWIDKISPNWSGAIPATLIVDKSGRFIQFYENSFTLEELEKTLTPFLK